MENTRAIDTVAAHAQRLFDQLAGRPAEAFPVGLYGAAKLALLDAIGCAIFGSQFEWARITAGLAGDGAAGPVTLLGSGRPAAPVAGALANGTAIHGFELDDVILGSLTHAGAGSSRPRWAPRKSPAPPAGGCWRASSPGTSSTRAWGPPWAPRRLPGVFIRPAWPARWPLRWQLVSRRAKHPGRWLRRWVSRRRPLRA